MDDKQTWLAKKLAPHIYDYDALLRDMAHDGHFVGEPPEGEGLEDLLNHEEYHFSYLEVIDALEWSGLYLDEDMTGGVPGRKLRNGRLAEALAEGLSVSTSYQADVETLADSLDEFAIALEEREE